MSFVVKHLQTSTDAVVSPAAYWKPYLQTQLVTANCMPSVLFPPPPPPRTQASPIRDVWNQRMAYRHVALMFALQAASPFSISWWFGGHFL